MTIEASGWRIEIFFSLIEKQGGNLACQLLDAPSTAQNWNQSRYLFHDHLKLFEERTTSHCCLNSHFPSGSMRFSCHSIHIRLALLRMMQLHVSKTDQQHGQNLKALCIFYQLQEHERVFVPSIAMSGVLLLLKWQNISISISAQT